MARPSLPSSALAFVLQLLPVLSCSSQRLASNSWRKGKLCLRLLLRIGASSAQWRHLVRIPSSLVISLAFSLISNYSFNLVILLNWNAVLQRLVARQTPFTPGELILKPRRTLEAERLLLRRQWKLSLNLGIRCIAAAAPPLARCVRIASSITTLLVSRVFFTRQPLIAMAWAGTLSTKQDSGRLCPSGTHAPAAKTSTKSTLRDIFQTGR